ncbi:MAG: peptide deformylase [Planctomycetes bacterium]|nr:peptide deformylase [Planctomycetota bacterium]
MDLQYTILTYPDPQLRQISQPVEEITDEVREKTLALFPAMYADNGIGLAAPQVGWHARVFVVNVTGKPEDELAFINPEITERSGGLWSFEEGCLSLPGIRGKVKRERKITLKGTDLEGKPIELSADGLVARCILHEFDHLDGILFIDRLSPAKRQSIKRRLRELEAEAAV